MEIIDLSEEHIEDARTIAVNNFEAERKTVPSLPPPGKMPDLLYPVQKGYGSAAFIDGEMAGFLCFYPFFEDAFGTTGVRGAFSPVHAHGAVGENRERIYSYLYQKTAGKLVKDKVLSHAIALYAHDEHAINSFFVNGFGMRCIDAIRPLDPIDRVEGPGCRFFELDKKKKGILAGLNNLLCIHLGSSPCFRPVPALIKKEFVVEKDTEDSRYFAAQTGGKIAAYMKIRETGENFITGNRYMANICGACCLPEYRGTGLYRNLLAFITEILADEGYTSIGVDFESFNPAARGFWLKYFTPYVSSVVRRIDEAVLNTV